MVDECSFQWCCNGNL